jgi:glyoxylase-like metal-dependent hydrolase (beta-lactamase superfamily II)
MTNLTEIKSPFPAVDTDNILRLAESIWVIGDKRVPLVPNIGIVMGTHSALVVDTGMGHANGLKVLEAARKLTGDRKLFLTLTHFHPEHGYGADAFKGEAEIIYNSAQANELARKGDGYLSMFRGMGPAIDMALFGTTLITADTLYETPIHEIDLGGRRAVLRTWGRAHTDADQIVYLPEDGVLFTGDLAEEKTFPIFPWFPPHDVSIDAENWVRVLDDCLSMKPAIVVPGHGDIGGPEILSGVRDYIMSIADEVGKAAASGADEEQMIAAIGPKMRAVHPDWYFPEWIDFAIRYHAAQLK